MDIVDQCREMAARRCTRHAIAIEVGLPITQLDRLLRVHGITTNGKRGVPPKPADDAGPIHGCGGKQPPKLMPSAEALRCVSVWSLALHDQTVLRSPV